MTSSIPIPEGGGVFLTARVCSSIRFALLRDLKEAKREQAAVAPEIVEAIGLIDNVGAWFENKRVSDVRLPFRRLHPEVSPR